MWSRLLVGPGGATAGYIFIGALVYLKEIGVLRNIDQITGCSIGALIAFLHVIDCDPVEMGRISEIICSKLDFRNFNFDTVIEAGGLFDIRDLEKILFEICQEHGYINPTLEQLYQATGIKFNISTTLDEKDNPQSVIYNYETHPHHSAIKVVCFSMYIPGLFYDSENIEYVDGALTDPYPCHTLDDGVNNVLGLYVYKEPDPGNRLNQLISTYQISMIKLRRDSMRQASNKVHHVRLQTSLMDVTGSYLTQESRLKLIFDGYKQIRSATESFKIKQE